MSAVLLQFPTPGYRAACRQVDEAIADIKRESARIEASYKARQERIDALLASIERDARRERVELPCDVEFGESA